jgi:hypothetical protein
MAFDDFSVPQRLPSLARSDFGNGFRRKKTRALSLKNMHRVVSGGNRGFGKPIAHRDALAVYKDKIRRRR